MSKKGEAIYILCDAQQRLISADADLWIQWIGRPLWWIPVKLCPQPLLSFPGGVMYNGHGNRNGGYLWDQKHGLPIPKAYVISHCWGPRLLAAETRWVFGEAQSLGWSASHLMAGWLLWTLPSWKGLCFVLPEIDTQPGNGFAFPTHKLLPHQPSVHLST